jgi:hypothetical protein
MCARDGTQQVRVRALRERKGYIQRATPEDGNGVLARGTRDTGLSLGNADDTATIWLAHASLLLLSN